MKINNIPVLLTSSVVAHDTSVALKNTEDRIKFAMESIKEWLNIDSDLKIVLCDGSGFNFGPLIATTFPGSSIEAIFFNNDQDIVAKHGRGFGEGEIVKYALEHSEFISSAGCFVKCTSKLWVKNYRLCLSKWNGNLLLKGVFTNVFSPFNATKIKHIDTRFYIVNIITYKNYFQNVHLNIKKDEGYGLEECFLDAIQKNDLKKCLFNVAPIICGVGGGTGLRYKTSTKRHIKEILKIKIIQKNMRFNHLLSINN